MCSLIETHSRSDIINVPTKAALNAKHHLDITFQIVPAISNLNFLGLCLVNRETCINMATLDRYFKPVTVTDAIASHSRPVVGAGACGSSPKRLTAKKRKVGRPCKHPRPSVQSSAC